MSIKKAFLIGIAALLLATGTASATESFVMDCKGLLVEVFARHSTMFMVHDETGNGIELPQKLFLSLGTDYKRNVTLWAFLGHRCKFVKLVD
jgi:hypothetical protein